MSISCSGFLTTPPDRAAGQACSDVDVTNTPILAAMPVMAIAPTAGRGTGGCTGRSLLHADAEPVLQLIKGGQAPLLERLVP
jgi:hypothetical protein